MIKVEETKRYQNKITSKGKLVLLKGVRDTWISTLGLCYNEKNRQHFISDNPYLNDQFSKDITPIKVLIISEIEKYIEGDFVLRGENIERFIEGAQQPKLIQKILVLPEQISLEILQMIVEGNLTNGDEVILECEGFFHPKEEWDGDMGGEFIKNIKLNKDNHVILIPDEWNEIEQEYMKENPPFSAPYPDFTDWLKRHYEAPKRKRLNK